MPNITIQTATVPEGTCPDWIIERWPELVALLTANLNGSLNVFNYGSSTPTPADQDKPWIKLDASGNPDGQYWVFKGGFWLKQHPVAPGAILLYGGDINALDAYDGGEAGDPTLTTGRMWERYAAMDAKFPLGLGTLPSGSVVGVGTAGGEEGHVLTLPELTPHSHAVKARNAQTDGGGAEVRLAPDAEESNSYARTFDAGGTAGVAVGHNTMPPWSGIGFIKRSIRQYYRA